MFKRKGKTSQQLRQTIQPKEINQKLQVKEGRPKRYRDRIKQYKQNKRFQNSNKKILPINRGRMHDYIPTTGYKGSKTILEQNLGTETK